MKLRIQNDDPNLHRTTRSSIEKTVRLVLGIRAEQIDSLQLTLTSPRRASQGIACRLTVKFGDGARACLEEEAGDAMGSIEWALWRLKHLLERRSLRGGFARSSS